MNYIEQAAKFACIMIIYRQRSIIYDFCYKYLHLNLLK
jgi:hypothetical protein